MKASDRFLVCLLTWLCCLAFTSCQGQVESSSYTKRNIYLAEYLSNKIEYYYRPKSNIKVIREVRTAYWRGDAEAPEELIYRYNKQGVLNGYTYYQPESFNRKGRKVFQYDNQGNLIKIINTGYVNYGTINGIPMDENGNPRPGAEDFEIFSEVHYTYDSKNRLTQEYWGDNEEREYHKYQYPEKGLVVATSYINSSPEYQGAIGSIDSLFFDSDQNCTQQIFNYYAGEELEERRRWWYEDGRIKIYTELGEYETGNPDSTLYQYDQWGNWMEKLIYRKDRSVQHKWTAEYELDARGNFTQARYAYGGRLRETVTREIEYWK